MKLYLDLDGIMADFDGRYFSLFGKMPHEVPDNVLWANINRTNDYFSDMEPCKGAQDFFGHITNLKESGYISDVYILTACPRTNYHDVVRQKRGWVRRRLLDDVIILPVIGGANKFLFMHEPGDILIDDFEKNCAPWRENGGNAILHESFDDTVMQLHKILFRR